jgi:hypothetical protein
MDISALLEGHELVQVMQVGEHLYCNHFKLIMGLCRTFGRLEKHMKSEQQEKSSLALLRAGEAAPWRPNPELTQTNIKTIICCRKFAMEIEPRISHKNKLKKVTSAPLMY